MQQHMLDKIEGVEFIATFSNAIDALNYISHSDVDLIFVDVEEKSASNVSVNDADN